MATSTAYAGVWSSLPTTLTPWIADVVSSLGHTQMTPVQAATIPLFMKNKDVVVEAVTGSGKTLAFVIPILERLIRRETKLKKNEVGALIISPTRELATQIHSVFSLFLKAQPTEEVAEGEEPPERTYPDPLLLISSDQSSPAQDVQRFLQSGADIVIGTPGRIEEFLLGRGQGSVSARELEVLVLDEADRLLDLGFQVSLTRILTSLPKQRRTGLFSATMTDALGELIRTGLRNPARVVVKVQSKQTRKHAGGEVIEERRIPANLENLYIPCRTSEKIVQLARIIQHEAASRGASHFIVYLSTGACVDYFYRILPRVFPSTSTSPIVPVLHSLHGNLPPAARTRTLAAFSTALATPQAPAVLLATDVAARGLDIPHVDVVVQVEPPADPKAFSHRCGRTARAGRSGRAYVLLCGREVEYVDFMAVRKIPLKRHPYILAAASEDMDVGEDGDEERLEDADVGRVQDAIRDFVRTDRTLHDLGAKALVSAVQAYSKHQASYIFRLKDLDIVGLSKAFGLLRLPRMPELRNTDPAGQGWADADVDWSTYAYADKAQEAKRLAEQAAKKTQTADRAEAAMQRRNKKKSNSAWSAQQDRRDEREKRREKKVTKRKWERTSKKAEAAEGEKAGEKATGQGEGDAVPAKRAASACSDDEGNDWKELAREERMAKKLKRGEVSQKAFDAEFGDL